MMQFGSTGAAASAAQHWDAQRRTLRRSRTIRPERAAIVPYPAGALRHQARTVARSQRKVGKNVSSQPPGAAE